MLFSFCSVGAAKRDANPNVIIINVDDLGYGDLGCYGATKVRTPNIDKLASEGMQFLDAHSASAVCTPSRYGLLTGEYPFRKNLWGPVFMKTPLILDTEQTTIASVMKSSGYATACIGKWHLGFGNERPVDWNKDLKPGPLELGFDYYFGVPVVNSHPPFVYVENHNVVGLVAEDSLLYNKQAETRWFPEKMDFKLIGGGKAAHALYDDRKVGTKLKDSALDWIVDHKDKPFFLYYATTNIHHPFTPAPRFIGTSEAGRYGDFIHELDWIVGELMQTLEEQGLSDNTMVIFTSDNGGMLNQGGQDAWRAGHRMNGDYLGFKFGAWEGGHRIPFIVHWPGKVKAKTTSYELVSNIDLMATMADLVDYKFEKGEEQDSKNILPAFFQKNRKPIRDHLVISPSSKNHLTIRFENWVYIGAQNEGGFGGRKIGEHTLGGAAAHLLTGQKNSDIENGKVKEDAAPAQLYDLQKDPYQTTNVYSQYPDVVEKMRELLEQEIAKSDESGSTK